jgi:hypothetical protein
MADRLVRGRCARIADETARALDQYEEDLREWTAVKREYDRAAASRKHLVEIDIYRDVSAMETYLEERLQEVVWPRETQVALEVKGAGELVMLDVELPEIEDMHAAQRRQVQNRHLCLCLHVSTLVHCRAESCYFFLKSPSNIALVPADTRFVSLSPAARESPTTASTDRRKARMSTASSSVLRHANASPILFLGMPVRRRNSTARGPRCCHTPGTNATPRPLSTRAMIVCACDASCTMLGTKPACQHACIIDM